MNLDLTEVDLQALVSKALFEAVGPVRRDELIEQAIKGLLKEEYGASALQNAFRIAVRDLVQQLVKDRVMTDPQVKAKLQELLDMAIQRALFTPEAQEKLVDKVSTALGDFLTCDRY